MNTNNLPFPPGCGTMTCAVGSDLIGPAQNSVGRVDNRVAFVCRKPGFVLYLEGVVPWHTDLFPLRGALTRKADNPAKLRRATIRDTYELSISNRPDSGAVFVFDAFLFHSWQSILNGVTLSTVGALQREKVQLK